MVPFNIPPRVGTEEEYIKNAIESCKICGDGQFTMKCNTWLEQKFKTNKALLTTSGSMALDIAAILCDIEPGDEVILPSFTFSSTANSFVMAGARLVFVDIRPDTMNIDETKIERAITKHTRAIIPVHYAGVACEMNTIIELAQKYEVKVVEDAAQGVMSSYKGKALGTIGDFGCYSFHETKNYTMGEGGAVLINNAEFIERAEIIREKGTDRSRFLKGQIDKYTWVDIGDSYLPSELNAAYLWAQLEKADEINQDRLHTWNRYYYALKPLADEHLIDIPFVPDKCIHNAHMFYVKLRDIDERDKFIKYLKERGVSSVFHYIPLHSSPAGLKYGRFSGVDEYTTKESERLTRLPLYYGMRDNEIDKVIQQVYSFFKWR